MGVQPSGFIFKIRTRSGCPISTMSYYPHEEELLLPPNWFVNMPRV